MPPQSAADRLAEMRAKQAELTQEIMKANGKVKHEIYEEEEQLEKEKWDMHVTMW